MLRVDNKKVITVLAKTTYRANRKRNILTVTAIFLTTFLICTVLSIGISYWNTISLRQRRMNGMDYDIELSEPRKDQISLIRKMENVKYAGLCVKCAVLSKYSENLPEKGAAKYEHTSSGKKPLDKIRLYWTDGICWKRQVIPALESHKGHYPTKENEIMLSKNALNSMGIKSPKTGMVLSLSYQTLNETTKENDELQKDFILSGWFLDYTGSGKGYISEAFYRSSGVKQTDFTQGALKISLKNPLYSETDIIDMQTALSLESNQIINADYDTISNFCKTAAGLVCLLLLVFFSGYLFIYNTMYISVTKDIRYYGQLKTLGATSEQLKSLIYKQLLWDSVIGIPIGLLFSLLAGKFAIPLVLHAVNPTLSEANIVNSPLWVFVLATAFAFLTTFVSGNKPAKIAKDCSPAEALKYIAAAPKIKNRRSRGGNLVSMVRQNLFRDKKQFIIILFSLSLAVSLFLVINIVISANNAENILNQTYDYDMRILNQTLLDEEKQVITNELIKKALNTKGIKNVRVLTAATATVPYQENVYGEYYKELYESRYSPGNYKKDMELYKSNPAHYLFTCRIVGIDGPEFDRLNQDLEKPLDKQEFENGGIAFVSKKITDGDNKIPGKTVRFSIPTADEPQKEETIKLGAVLDSFPAYYSAGYTPDLIVSQKYLEKLIGKDTFVEMLKIDYDKAFSQSTEKAVSNLFKNNQLLSMDSKLQRYTDMKNTENQVTILGNSIGFIIMLLSLLNFVNMMSASIQNRAKEFAVLESIGMTRRQIREMITLESLSYACMSIILSVLIGLPAGWFIFHSFNIYRISFSLPIASNLILFGFIILSCVFTARLILNRSNNETIIELLRKEDN